MSEQLTMMTREISAKLPAGQLNLVCENAPEGTNADGVSYKELCNRCLIDTSTENQKACVAGVVAGFVQERQSGAVPQPEQAPTELSAACTDPNDPACLGMM